MRITLFMLFVLSALEILAQGQLTVMPKRGHYQPLEVRKIDVDVELDGRTALTTVTHTFNNKGHRWEEGRFVFPLPKGAVIEDFSMWIGGKEMRGEFLEAKKAKTIYEGIVRSMKDPALLEYRDGGLLSLRVFPIEARKEKVVKLVFREVLTRKAALRQWRWPMKVATIGKQKIGTFEIDVKVKTNETLNTLYVPTHQCEIKRKKKRGSVHFIEHNFRSGSDFEVLFSLGHKGVGMDLLTHKDGRDTFFWMTLIPDMTANTEVVARDVIFLVDSSGSMAGPKMDQAKAALRFCVANLNPNDRFEIIRFSTVGSSFGEGWRQVSEEARKAAYAYIDKLPAVGGTNMEEGLRLAASLPQSHRQRMVILLSDGKPTIGETKPKKLLNTLDQDKLRIHPVGIGYKINTALLGQMSEKSGGMNVYVAPEEDLELKLSNFYEEIKSPLLVNPHLEAEGVTLSDMHPRRLRDLYKGQALHIFGRFEGRGKGRITLKGDLNAKQAHYRFVGDFEETDENAFIAKLWARRRVGWLLENIQMNGEVEELVTEVRDLGERFEILTPYNSRLILEDGALPGVAESAETDDAIVITASAPEPEDFYTKLPTARSVSSVMELAPGENSGRQAFEARKKVTSYQEELVVIEEPKQKIRRANQRVFEWMGDRWYERILRTVRVSRTEKVTFGSDRYFELAEDKKIKEILKLGDRVDFLYKGALVEIRPE